MGRTTISQDSRELDLDIVSNSWRSVTDHDAHSKMLDAWGRKLALAQQNPRIPLIDSVLRNQLASLDHLLSDRREVQIEDPVELELAATPAPAMVLSPQGLVAALNFGGANYFGVKQGLRAGTEWLREDSLADFASVHDAGVGKSNIDYAIVRINDERDDGAIAEVYKLEIEGTDGAYTVVRSLELDWDPSISQALMKAFGLTQAESEICELLFAHRDLAIIAEQRSVALGTVRMQVKSILSKVEVHSKTDLVRLLAQLCARSASKRSKTDINWTDPLDNETIITRKDGRKLAFSWSGAEDGRPVLYLPDHTTCSLFPETVRTQLEERGVKLMSLSLPGFGNSDPAGDRDQLEDGCAAIEEWCAAMQFGALPAIAGRGSQFYLLHLARRRPDLFTMLMSFGLPWNITSKRTESMRSVDLTTLKLSLDAPFAYGIACRLGYRLIKKHGPDFYWKRIFSSNEADIETAKDLEAPPLLRATVSHIFAQGYDAFRRSQQVCAGHEISETVMELQTPLHWLIPELSAELGADGFEEIRQLNPNSTVEVVPDTGELLAFQKPDLFVERVVALADHRPASVFAGWAMEETHEEMSDFDLSDAS